MMERTLASPYDRLHSFLKESIMKARSFALFPSLPSLLLVLLASAAAAAGLAHTQTIVPNLDQEGRKGDMARLAHKQAQDKFNAADADKDNRISQEEASKTLPYVAEQFARYDKDKDGFLTWEEFVGHNRWKKD